MWLTKEIVSTTYVQLDRLYATMMGDRAYKDLIHHQETKVVMLILYAGTADH